MIDGWTVFCYIVLIWLSLDLPEDTSTRVQVMAWCRQATSHYLNQCWPRSPTPYGATRPQWVKIIMSINWSLMAIKIYIFQNTTWIKKHCHQRWKSLVLQASITLLSIYLMPRKLPSKGPFTPIVITLIVNSYVLTLNHLFFYFFSKCNYFLMVIVNLQLVWI